MYGCDKGWRETKGEAVEHTRCTASTPEPYHISLKPSHPPGHRLEYNLAGDSGGLPSPLSEALLRPDRLPTAQILEQLYGPGTEAL